MNAVGDPDQNGSAASGSGSTSITAGGPGSSFTATSGPSCSRIASHGSSSSGGDAGKSGEMLRKKRHTMH